MLVLHLLGWWYSRGWAWILEMINTRLKDISESFSVGILMRTLFSPWKQIQSPSSFQNFLQSKVDNFISRFIGATVRLGMLLGALISTIGVLMFGILAVILWPILPFLVFVLPVLSFAGGN